MPYFLIAAAVAALDQLVKKWVVDNVALYGQAPLLPGVVHLTYVRNTGAAFSFFTDMRWPLTVVTVILAAAIVVFLLKSRVAVFGKIAAGAVLGGAVGNLTDRLTRGFVVDMIEVEFIHYPVFNVADCFIVVGAIAFFVWYLFFEDRKPPAEKKPLMPEIDRLAGRPEAEEDPSPMPDDFSEPEPDNDDGKDG